MIPRRLTAVLLACALALQPLRAADDLPELGDVASNELPPLMEKRIGRQIMNEIRLTEPSYLDDADIEGYLTALGGKLVAASVAPDLGFVFFALSDPSINAFALPGGYIGVHSGLILAAQTESELAGVLAHEISHVTQRHIARQIYQSSKMSLPSMLAMGLALLAARSNSQVASGAIAATTAGSIAAQLAYSRDFEREADRIGFELMRKAGFDVRGMAVFFGSLQQATRHYENNATAYLRTHPITGERLTDMQNREGGVHYRQVPDSPEFHLARAKLRAMQGTPAEATGHFERLLAERKFASEEATRYGLAYALFRARDWAAAEREVQKARGGKAADPMIERLYAEIRLARGDADGALAIYRGALARSPRHAGLHDGYAQALLTSRRFTEALRFADEQLQWQPESTRHLRVRAASHAGLGHEAQQHQALADVFALQGLTLAAIEQLELAQKAGDADFFVMSAIDARLRELKRQRLDEMRERRD
ncbi:MAG: M48 family metalloprotease [Betaproteobacteria bacterium]|nr:M48 family metalloprotease [Betaproteobacteria bacterium]MCL2885790.1 M48 family metalloprotease [Betaproteobacteria bacterium]